MFERSYPTEIWSFSFEKNKHRAKKISALTCPVFRHPRQAINPFCKCLVVIQMEQTILMGFSSSSSWHSAESLMKLQPLEDFTRYPNVQLAYQIKHLKSKFGISLLHVSAKCNLEEVTNVCLRVWLTLMLFSVKSVCGLKRECSSQAVKCNIS